MDRFYAFPAGLFISNSFCRTDHSGFLGGSYGKAQDRALFTDASNHSGIAINRESGASMTKTCLQVQSGSVTWDLVVTGSGGAAAAAADGCLEKLITVSMSVIFILDCIRITVLAPTCLPR